MVTLLVGSCTAPARPRCRGSPRVCQVEEERRLFNSHSRRRRAAKLTVRGATVNWPRTLDCSSVSAEDAVLRLLPEANGTPESQSGHICARSRRRPSWPGGRRSKGQLSPSRRRATITDATQKKRRTNVSADGLVRRAALVRHPALQVELSLVMY